MQFFSNVPLRSGLWDISTQLERNTLPSAGNILKEISKGNFDGADYDEKLPQWLKDTLY
ncbi:pyridoxamine 5'-phosphate oxidase [Xenorhabdus hominickii]|uniref:Pyridoxamine 5'-phosphate oxidase n=1 Tax=Xenorhabdus hominickii TaxID=351679 RepID=A0A2G0PXJ6_XENHO|nr:pyridoxamine 5'-phosphate oxidase [Xenorhabdus hominickii]PHM54327.1 pyridoxamine 5'-phosphate oxidase [Xenorhabdus hominickii]